MTGLVWVAAALVACCSNVGFVSAVCGDEEIVDHRALLLLPLSVLLLVVVAVVVVSDTVTMGEVVGSKVVVVAGAGAKVGVVQFATA